MLVEHERRTSERLAELERRVRAAENEARGAKHLVLKLAKEGLRGMLDVYSNAIAKEREEDGNGDDT